MLHLSAPTPSVVASCPPDGDVVARALREAGTVSGGYAGPPCAFRPLGPDVSALVAPLRPAGADAGVWVLVTARGTGEADHRVHLRERSLTAAQRFMLALACEGIDSRWIDAVPDRAAFRSAGLSLDGHDPVGLVWCDSG